MRNFPIFSMKFLNTFIFSNLSWLTIFSSLPHIKKGTFFNLKLVWSWKNHCQTESHFISLFIHFQMQISRDTHNTEVVLSSELTSPCQTKMRKRSTEPLKDLNHSNFVFRVNNILVSFYIYWNNIRSSHLILFLLKPISRRTVYYV